MLLRPSLLLPWLLRLLLLRTALLRALPQGWLPRLSLLWPALLGLELAGGRHCSEPIFLAPSGIECGAAIPPS